MLPCFTTSSGLRGADPSLQSPTEVRYLCGEPTAAMHRETRGHTSSMQVNLCYTQNGHDARFTLGMYKNIAQIVH